VAKKDSDQQVNNMELIRNCPLCNIEIHYKYLYLKTTADSKNSVCKHCRVKWVNKRYGDLLFTYEIPCKNCGKLKCHYTSKGATKSYVEKLQKNPKKLCRSCSNSLYYNPGLGRKNTKPELEAKQYFDLNNINYIQQYAISGSHYDFYLTDRNILVEIDGSYWHGKNLSDIDLNKQQLNTRKNDYKKNSIAKLHNIPLLRIWDDEIELLSTKIKQLYV
jgi:very-short-patch-repair endonuclease